MNEFFAADPAACLSSSDLRFLLSHFGPHAGRYLADYPATWASDIALRCEAMGPVEGERAKVLIRRAYEKAALLRKASIPWKEGDGWLENFRRVLKERPGEFERGIVAGESDGSDVVSMNDLELSPTADESIEAVAGEYVRVSRTLLLLSPELTFVDPYLNPCKNDRQDVISAMLRSAAKGKCRRVTCWARGSEIVSEKRHTWEEVRAALERVLSSACWPSDREFRYLLVDDATCRSKMHPRYLFSIKGGIRFDQGFQRLPKGRRNDVSPLGAQVLEDVLATYRDGGNDMEVVRTFETGR